MDGASPALPGSRSDLPDEPPKADGLARRVNHGRAGRVEGFLIGPLKHLEGISAFGDGAPGRMRAACSFYHTDAGL